MWLLGSRVLFMAIVGYGGSKLPKWCKCGRQWLAVQGASNVAVAVSGTGTFVRGNMWTVANNDGRGIAVGQAGNLVFGRSFLNGNRNIGLIVAGEGSHAELINVDVVNTESDVNGLGGRGIEVQRGASLEVSQSRVLNNREFGVLISDSDTMVALNESQFSPVPRGVRNQQCVDLSSCGTKGLAMVSLSLVGRTYLCRNSPSLTMRGLGSICTRQPNLDLMMRQPVSSVPPRSRRKTVRLRAMTTESTSEEVRSVLRVLRGHGCLLRQRDDHRWLL